MIGQRMPDTQWKKPEQACGWAKYRLYYEPPVWTYRKRSAPRTPRKVGRLYTGQARRISLGYCAGASFWPKGWGPCAAIHAAAVIRRAR